MSSLFSDPPFARGTSLLNKEVIDIGTDYFPVAGREIVGSVKAFSDVNPGTGPAAVRYSNRLVYCMACRYVGTSALNPADNGADKGKFFVIDRANPLGAQFRATAAATDALNGKMVGVLDEYLTTEVRTNDIVWLVIGGPTSAVKAASSTIVNNYVEVSSGVAVTGSTVANRIGFSADPSATVTVATAGTSGGTTVGISTTIGNLYLIAAGSVLSGTGVTAGTKVASVSSLSVSGTTVTATLTVDTVFSGAVSTGTDTLTLTTQSYSGTAVRVNIDCNLI
jgi:hypothetical protein